MTRQVRTNWDLLVLLNITMQIKLVMKLASIIAPNK
jgi:hypothetical protein